MGTPVSGCRPPGTIRFVTEREERDPQEAIEEMREKRAEGDELSDEEREFLESERVRLDPGEGTGTPVA